MQQVNENQPSSSSNQQPGQGSDGNNGNPSPTGGDNEGSNDPPPPGGQGPDGGPPPPGGQGPNGPSPTPTPPGSNGPPPSPRNPFGQPPDDDPADDGEQGDDLDGQDGGPRRERLRVKEADEIKLLSLPQGTAWRAWRASNTHAIVSAAGRHDDSALEWIMKTESHDEAYLNVPGTGWVALDRKFAAGISKIPHGELWRTRATLR